VFRWPEPFDAVAHAAARDIEIIPRDLSPLMGLFVRERATGYQAIFLDRELVPRHPWYYPTLLHELGHAELSFEVHLDDATKIGLLTELSGHEWGDDHDGFLASLRYHGHEASCERWARAAYLGGAEGLPKDKLLRAYLADTRRGHLDGKPHFDENDVLEFATHLVPPGVGRVSLKWMTDVLNTFHQREEVPGSNYSEQSWRSI